MKKLVLTAVATLIAGSAMALSTTYDFNTDQSASFVVREFGGPDSNHNFSFDYSTLGIPPAPNGTGTIGLASQTNLSAGAGNSLTFYPDVTGLNLADGDWEMTFDVWGNLGTDSGSSTEFFGFGAQADSTGPGVGSDGANGFNVIITCDGGSSNDFRYAQGAGPMVGDNTLPNWWGTNAVNNTATEWTTYFPNTNIGVTGIDPGDLGHQWVTVRLRVTNSGADRSIAFKQPGYPTFAVVGNVTAGTGAFAAPCIGHADFFASVQTGDQYFIFDNLVINDTVDASDVSDWTLY